MVNKAGVGKVFHDHGLNEDLIDDYEDKMVLDVISACPTFFLMSISVHTYCDSMSSGLFV